MIIFVATRYVKYWWLTMKDYMGGHFNHAFKVNLEKSRLSFITEYVLSLSWYRVNHIMLERCLCLIFIWIVRSNEQGVINKKTWPNVIETFLRVTVFDRCTCKVCRRQRFYCSQKHSTISLYVKKCLMYIRMFHPCNIHVTS